MQEHMGNLSREIEILGKNKKEGPEVKSTVIEMKTQLRKEKLTLRISQQKLPKLKSKEKKQTRKNKVEYQEL